MAPIELVRSEGDDSGAAPQSPFGFLDTPGIDLVREYMEHGPHPSYKEFENVLGGAMRHRGVSDVWKFIEDAVSGTGGFVDGSYIIGFKKEFDANGNALEKLTQRRAATDYDQFASEVCMAPWDVIMQHYDAIRRASENDDAGEFWANADRQGNDILGVTEFAFRQARMYLTGWLVIDAPPQTARTAEDEKSIRRRPYMYAVRTRNVPRWSLDENDELEAVLILEPTEQNQKLDSCPFRVWSRSGWATFTREGKNVTLTDSAVNGTGVVPIITVHDHKPEGDNYVGPTDMLNVARLAQTVYNQDSESREHERKAALFLAMGVKDVKNFAEKSITVGLDSVMLYDGEAAPPAYVSPDLTIVDKLQESRERKKAAAYEAANMRAVVGAIQTSSGFHAEVEFSKSERRIARYAAALETAERRATEIYLRFRGATDEQIEAAKISISYPRKFSIKNVGEIQEQSQKLFEVKPGLAVVTEQFVTLLSAMFPRTDGQKIRELADEAAKSHLGLSEGGAAKTLNGAQITAALEIASQLASKTVSQTYAIELLSRVDIDPESAAKMVQSITADDRPNIDTIVQAVTKLAVPVSQEWFVQQYGLQVAAKPEDAMSAPDADSAALSRMQQILGSSESAA